MQITETRSSYVIILDWTLFGIPLCKHWIENDKDDMI